MLQTGVSLRHAPYSATPREMQQTSSRQTFDAANTMSGGRLNTPQAAMEVLRSSQSDVTPTVRILGRKVNGDGAVS